MTTPYKRMQKMLLGEGQKAARGVPKHAMLRDDMVFFLTDDLNNVGSIPVKDYIEYALGMILQQYSIRAGLQKFGERAQQGVTMELKQLHSMKVLHQAHKTEEENNMAISSLMSLKKVRQIH
jgi:hypothetical protein